MTENKCSEMICSYPFYDFQISVNGNMTACCSSWCKNYKIGNVFDDGVDAVWNSKAAKEFRKSILDDSYKFCDRKICFPQFTNRNDILRDCKKNGFMRRGPKHIGIQYDESCNVCCTTCRAKPIINSPEYQNKIDALIESVIIPLCKDAEIVSALGTGEVFASKHCRVLIPRLAEIYPKLKFNIQSNGILCNEKSMRELGIYHRISGLLVSIHAATKETYDKIVIGGDFEQVWKNVEWLSGLKRMGMLSTLELVFVVNDINFREMKAFLERATSLDVYADFWQYQQWGREPMAARGDQALVWKAEHPHYPEFKQILSDEIFASPYCRMSEQLLQQRRPLYK